MCEPRWESLFPESNYDTYSLLDIVRFLTHYIYVTKRLPGTKYKQNP